MAALAATPVAGLLERVSAGDPQAYSDFVEPHLGALVSFAVRVAGDEAMAEDAVQDVLAQAYRTLQRKSTDDLRALAVRPWLFRCAINRIRRLKGRRREATVGLVLDDDAVAPSAEDEATQRRRVQTVDRELQRLPRDWRAAILLRHHSGYSYQEVARMLGRPEGTVKAWVHRGVRVVRAALVQSEAMEA